jgi:predicted dehydrogenase
LKSNSEPAKAGAAAAVRIALIGQRFMGRAHANAWSQAGKFFDLARPARLEATAGRDAEASSAFAERWGFRRVVTDWRTLVADPEVDLVDVATPNDLHAAPALAALAAGKHVACEKPLAGTLDDARLLRDAAKNARRAKTFVWHNYRRCPAIGLAYRLLREGRLGRVIHVRATYLQSWGGPETPSSWRFEKRRAGSGAHGDLNAHLVDLARFLVQEPVVEIHGAVARTFVKERVGDDGRRKKSDVDDAVLFLATFKGGATASFEASRLAHGHLNDNAIEINGEGGSLAFSFEDPNVLRFCDAADGPRVGGWRRVVATHAGDHPYVERWWPDGHGLGYEHGFVNMAADMLRVLAGEEPELPLPDFADGYETCRVLEAALLSARSRAAVKLAEVV